MPSTMRSCDGANDDRLTRSRSQSKSRESDASISFGEGQNLGGSSTRRRDGNSSCHDHHHHQFPIAITLLNDNDTSTSATLPSSPMMHTPATPNTPTPQDLNLDAVNLDVFGPRSTPSMDLESYAVLLRVFYVTVISQTPHRTYI